VCPRPPLPTYGNSFLNPGLCAPTFSSQHDQAAVAADDLQTIANRFSAPPMAMYNEDRTRVTLTANWAVGITGTEEIYTNLRTGTCCLRHDSCVRAEGLVAGITAEVMQWLTGDPLAETINGVPGQCVHSHRVVLTPAWSSDESSVSESSLLRHIRLCVPPDRLQDG
jgi:hypothetical protein